MFNSVFLWISLLLSLVSNHIYCLFFVSLFFSLVTVNEGGIKTASNLCPDPGEPENGKRIGSDFR